MASTTAQTPPPGPSSKKRKMSGQSVNKIHIGFIGAGNIARSILEGLILSGEVSKSTMFASCTSELSENFKKTQALGINVSTSNRQVIFNSDILVIAVKPNQVADVMEEIQGVFREFPSPSSTAKMSASVTPPKNFRPVVVSVATGVQIRDIEQKTEISWMIGGYPVAGHLPVIRCIPTVACSIRAGVMVYSRGRYCNESDVKPFLNLFSLTGYCEEVPEKHIDAFTAFSGSGVAFMAVILEAMTDGGVLVGIPKPMAQRVAAHTMMSTARMITERGQSPGEVRAAVASPGGTTIHGIQVMEEKGARASIMGAVQRAAERAAELRPIPSKPPDSTVEKVDNKFSDHTTKSNSASPK